MFPHGYRRSALRRDTAKRRVNRSVCEHNRACLSLFALLPRFSADREYHIHFILGLCAGSHAETRPPIRDLAMQLGGGFSIQRPGAGRAVNLSDTARSVT